jgi:predicted N-acetyltransferase YhbS
VPQNFKKSWHPAVRGNIEKVWKAEQQALTEKRKTEQLMKELHEERAREEIARVAEDTGHRYGCC